MPVEIFDCYLRSSDMNRQERISIDPEQRASMNITLRWVDLDALSEKIIVKTVELMN